jgi:hypothetical protein
VLERRRQETLDSDLLIELQVLRRNDDPHPADTEHTLNAIFPRE